MLRFIFISFVCLCVVLLEPAAGVCFKPNGTTAEARYKPCRINPSDPLSTVCCEEHNQCLENGLCLYTPPGGREFWRESCTKKDWSEGGCQDLCSTGGPMERMYDVRVTPCSGNATSLEWCCGSTTDCCTEAGNLPKFTIALKFGDPRPARSAGSSSSSRFPSLSTLAPTSSSTLPTATPSPTVNQALSTSDLSTGAKVGIGIGATVVAIACVALGILVGRTRQPKKVVYAPEYEQDQQYAPFETYRHEANEIKRAQLDGMYNQVHELPSAYGAELSGGHNVPEVSVTLPTPRP